MSEKTKTPVLTYCEEDYSMLRDDEGRIVAMAAFAPHRIAALRHAAHATQVLPELIEACELAEKWLANCIPTVELDGPKPLPILAKALARAKGKEMEGGR